MAFLDGFIKQDIQPAQRTSSYRRNTTGASISIRKPAEKNKNPYYRLYLSRHFHSPITANKSFSVFFNKQTGVVALVEDDNGVFHFRKESGALATTSSALIKAILKMLNLPEEHGSTPIVATTDGTAIYLSAVKVN